MSRDPLLYGAGDMNLYGYCMGNPANETDPSGKIAPLLVILGIMVVGALIAGALNAVRQGIRYAETGQSWSWGEFGESMLFGAVAAPLFVLLPEVMIPLTVGLGLASAADEYSQGHVATGTFDLVTSLLPFASKSVRSQVFGRNSWWAPKPEIVSRFSMMRITTGVRYRGMVLEEPMMRHAFRTGEPISYARTRSLEMRYGSENVHASYKHGPWTTIQQQVTRVLTGVDPTGGRSPTSAASRFFTWRGMYLSMRQAIRMRQVTPRQPRYSVPMVGVGEGVRRPGGGVQGPVTHFKSDSAVFRMDAATPEKFYTGFPEEP